MNGKAAEKRGDRLLGVKGWWTRSPTPNPQPPIPERLVVLAAPRSPAAEAYRTLAANLRFGGGPQPVRTILFTSPGPGDGKSPVLANLGVAAAQGGIRVILVDADLRHPQLHDIFDLPNGAGLATTLAPGATGGHFIQQTAIERLRVVTSGPPPDNPADLLGSSRLADALSALEDDADLVALDAPPVAGVADASLLAPRVDGVVLVVDARRTRRQDALGAKAQLQRVNAPLLGVVVNNADPRDAAYGY
jgi:non-specific protein-tyrosine kinase